jgi:hypothetical protein
MRFTELSLQYSGVVDMEMKKGQWATHVAVLWQVHSFTTEIIA